MLKVLKSLQENRWYIVMFLVGFCGAALYTHAENHDALGSSVMLTALALVASFLIPFAAFSYQERSNSWILQNAPMVAFGVYGMTVCQSFTMIKLILMIMAMAMHLSYWKSSLHSRNYRLDQFKLGYAAQFPNLTQLIASLNGMGRSELADDLVVAVLSHTKPQDVWWQQIPNWVPDQLRNEARNDFEV